MVEYRQEGRVAVLTINRPEARNAVNGEVASGLEAALFRLPRALPRNVAMELALTGDPIDAERAHAFGLVNELVEPGTALKAALALAERINANAPIAVRQSRRVVLEGMLADDDTAWKVTADAMGTAMSTEDFAEGPRAFIEKRPPEWKGR